MPDGLSDFAEALANPIKYQSELEKRSEQLAVLMEDGEPTEEDASNSCKCTQQFILIPLLISTRRRHVSRPKFPFGNCFFNMFCFSLIVFAFRFNLFLTNFSFLLSFIYVEFSFIGFGCVCFSLHSTSCHGNGEMLTILYAFIFAYHCIVFCLPLHLRIRKKTHHSFNHCHLIHARVCVCNCIRFVWRFVQSISDVLVSLGSKKEMRSLEVTRTSPKHRASIVATSSLSMDASIGNDLDYTSSSVSTQPIQHQLSLDQSCSTSKASSTFTSTTTIPITAELSECNDIVAESLEKILENKLVREKRIEMEKKLETMRKKHDKEKIRVTSQRSGDLTDGIRKSKFYMNNKLVKRLSNKNL